MKTPEPSPSANSSKPSLGSSSDDASKERHLVATPAAAATPPATPATDSLETTSVLAALPTKEREGRARNGWKALVVILLGWLLTLAVIAVGIVVLVLSDGHLNPFSVFGVVLLVVGFIAIWVFSFLSAGFFTLQPNEARVLVLFGEYRGTIRRTGFYWANPFYSSTLTPADISTDDDDEKKSSAASGQQAVKAKISLRARTLNGSKLKVNDKNGNPIEIATVIVWHIVDTAKAVFDVDHYDQFVSTQSETALRHVASLYAYDQDDADSTGTDDSAHITLRSNILEVSKALQNELAQRLRPAGITVDDARLTHLAYAPEIAQVMLRRQQADAIISARTKIVQGAVSMVDLALKELEKDDVVSLDEERKATMISNLMVVLCADNDAQPVINTGSLYN